MSHMLITTASTPNKVILEPLSKAHLPTLYEISRDKSSIEDFQKASPDYEYFMSWIRDALSDEEQAWTILVDGLVCGLINFENIKEPECEIGFFLAKRCHRKGITTHGVRTALSIIEGDYPHVQKVIAKVTATNIASNHLLERCGFQHVRTVKRDWEWDGILHDSHEYSWCPKAR